MMLSIVSIVLILIGIIFITFAPVMGVNSLPGVTWGLYILGAAQICMGVSIQRLNRLEERLSRFIYDFDSDDLPMIRCDRCGRKYDMDVKKCPYCELARVKKSFFTRG